MARRRRHGPRWPLVLLGVVLLLPVAAWLFLVSPPGEELLRRQLVPRLDAALAGRVEVQRLELGLGGELTLGQLRLWDPEGQLVARLGELRLQVGLLGLANRRLEVQRLELIRPQLSLTQDRRGLNLARALAPARPSPPAKPVPRSSRAEDYWVVRLQEVTLHQGRIVYDGSGSAPGTAPQLALGDLELRVQGHYQAYDRDYAGSLQLEARLERPFAAPLTLALQGDGRGLTGDGLLELTLDGRGRLALSVVAAEGGPLRLQVSEATLPPELAAKLLPGWPLLAAVQAEGELRLLRDQLRVDVDLTGGGARLGLDAAVRLSGPEVESLRLRGNAIDLARLVAGGPASDLAFDLQARGRPASAGEAGPSGALTLSVPPGTVAGRKLGPVELTLSGGPATGWRLGPLDAQLPGLRLTGNGLLRTQGLGLAGQVVLQDLESAVAATGALAPPQVRQLEGEGELSWTLQGPLRHPALQVIGRFPRLGLGPQQAEEIQLRLELADLGDLAAGDAGLELVVGRLRAAGQAWRGLTARVALRQGGRRGFEGALGVAGPQALGLQFAGRRATAAPGAGRGGAAETLRLEQLSLRYPGNAWQLQRPATLVLRGGVGAGATGALSLDALALAAGAQRLTVSDVRRGARGAWRGRVQGTALALEQLPRALLAQLPELAGQLDLDLRLTGSERQPALIGELAWRRGRLAGLEGLELRLRQLRVDAQRAAGELQLASPLGQARAKVDLPLRWPWPAGARLQAEFDVPGLELAPLVERLQLLLGEGVALPQLAGGLCARGTISGRAGDPELDLSLAGQRLAYGERTLGDLQLALRGGHRLGRLEVRLAGVGPFGRGEWVLGLPWSPGEVLRQPGRTLAGLRQGSLDLSGQWQGLPLAELARFGAADATALGGTLDLRAVAHGPLASSRGSLELALHDLVRGGLPPIDGRLELRFDAQQTQLWVEARRPGQPQPLGLLQARLASPPAGLLRPAQLAATPIQAELRLGPLALARLIEVGGAPAQAGPAGGGLLPRAAAATPRSGAGPPPLPTAAAATGQSWAASLRGRLQLEGTLGAPRLTGEVTADPRSPVLAPLGQALLEISYADSLGRLRLSLPGLPGGPEALSAIAELRTELSLPVLLAGGGALATAPLRAEVRANNLDLVPFSGIFEQVRRISGRLDGSLVLEGTPADPHLQGQLAWRQGRLYLLGYGRYREIDLLLQGNDRELVLQRLTAKGGDGRIQADGRLALQPVAARAGAPTGRPLELRLALERFPLYSQGQPLVVLTLKASAEGQVSEGQVDVRALRIPEAHVRLPGGKRRDLQELDSPDDVVLLVRGQPATGDDRRRLARLQQERREVLQAPRGGEADTPAVVAEGAPARASSGAGALRSPAGAGGGAGQQGGGGAAATAQGQRRLRVRLDAPRNIWVVGDDLNLELGFSEGFTLDVGDKSAAYGDILVQRGRLDALGRRFDLVAGSSLHLTGPVSDPQLDINARHVNDKEQITVFLAVQGSAKAPKLTVRSEPELTETEIFSLLATGRTEAFRPASAGEDQSGGPGVVQSEAVSLVGGLIAAQVQKALRSRLPLDVLSIQAGEGLTGSRLEAGTYVTSDLYVGYVGRIGADPLRQENSNAVHVELQLGRRWSLEAEYGDARTGAADLVWTKRY